MKKIILICFCSFLVQNIHSQSYQVLNSASGTNAGFETLIDNDDVFGYAEVRKLDLEDKLTEKFKYIVLDKNMNSVCTGEFTQKLVKKKCENKIFQIVYNNNHILFFFTEYFNDRNNYLQVRDSYQILDISTNKIVSSGFFDKTLNDDMSIPKLYSIYQRRIAIGVSDIGFMIQAKKEFDDQGLQTFYYVMDFNSKIVWEQVNKTAEEKHFYDYTLFDKDKENAVFLLTKMRRTKKVSDHILVLNAKTGKEIAFTDFSNEKYTMRFSSVDVLDGKVQIIGRFFEKEKRDRVDTDESLGLYRRVIDIKSGKILNEDFLTYDKFKNPNIDENGRIRKEGNLNFSKFNINPDGSYFIIAETYIDKSRGAMFTELYSFTLDKDFAPIEMKSFDVNRTRGSKYSFSQELPNKVGKAYFFYDKNEDKNLQLNILKYMYASKKMSIDKMVLTSQKSNLNVVRAKTGYVGIIESFKNAGKGEKQLEIRLEKINYER